jgi:Major Facilitator Superfamily
MRFLALLELRPPITQEEKARIAKAPKELSWRGVVAFLAVLMGALASILQESIGLFALPDFEGALNVTQDQGYWTLTSYLIGEVGITPLAPFLFLSFGGRRLLLTCSTLFALSAVAVYLPLGFGAFLGLRFFQGMAAGPLVPMLMIAALRIFPAQPSLSYSAPLLHQVSLDISSCLMAGDRSFSIQSHFAFSSLPVRCSALGASP